MRFSEEFLDEIRARLPVSEVVGRRVRLKRQGREWRGLSPFNSEKTPSFFVNDQKGFYHDFSAGKHGDIFTFLIETEGVTFPEAVERLAHDAGLSLPKPTPEVEERERRRKTLHEVVECAAVFFQEQLRSRAGGDARAYLAKRGLTAATIAEFGLGYAPGDRGALKQHLAGKGIPVADMIDAGLLIAGEDIAIPYDRFRNRVMFPIHDARGRVVAFGGRALSDDVEPKYLNSPETGLFHKGAVVFNFHRAREAAHDDGSVVAVEGYIDAIAVYQAGLKSVVATMGTALTEPQMETLWRLSDQPIICFDGDDAGLRASYRVIDRMLPILRAGRSFQFAFPAGAKDPDEFIRDRGLPAFKDVLRGALPLWDVLWRRETGSGPSQATLKNPDVRAAFEHRLYSVLEGIKDAGVRAAYRQTCRVELSDLFWRATTAKGASPRSARGSAAGLAGIGVAGEGGRSGIQKILLGLLVHYPQFLQAKSDSITSVHFPDKLERFRGALYELLIDAAELDVAVIYQRLSPVYYDVLDDVHGDDAERSKRGHRLIRRFPILEALPPEEFIDHCIEHFISVLQVDQMTHELAEMTSGANADSAPDADILGERLGSMVRDLHAAKAAVELRDRELADEAKEIRRLGEKARVGDGMAA